MNMFKRDEGSFVLEAALILPFFMAFVIALISMTHISMVAAALQTSVSETVKVVSAHMYPIQILLGDSDMVTDGIDGLIPDGLVPVIEALAKQRDEIRLDRNSEWDALLGSVLTPLVQFYADDRIIRKSELQVIKVILPDFQTRDREGAFFGIEATYRMKLVIPFFQKDIELTRRAYERVWIGA